MIKTESLDYSLKRFPTELITKCKFLFEFFCSEKAKKTSIHSSIDNIDIPDNKDVIDMTSAEDKEQLLAAMRSFVKADPVKTEVIDLTRLGLMELTRKKTRRPLHEQLGLFCT